MQHYFKRFYLFLIALMFYGSQLAAQTFESITPNHGGPGTPVTITGTGLSNIAFIEFGLIRVPAVPNFDGTMVSAELPIPVVQFETPGVVAIVAIDSSNVIHPTGLQFAIRGTWTVVVSNFGVAGGKGKATTFQVIEGQTPPAAAIVVRDLTPPTFNGCNGVAIHPSGRTAYVANNEDNTISAIDNATNSVKGVVTVGKAPFALAINTLGTRAYVTNFSDGTISILNISGTHEQAPVIVGNPIPSDSVPSPGPRGIAVSFDNSTLYVCNLNSGHIVSFSLSNPDVPVMTSLGVLPPTFKGGAIIAVTADNKRIYVNDANIQKIDAFDLPLHGQMPDALIDIPATGPRGMTINREGTRLYFVCNEKVNTNQIGVIDIATNQLNQIITINATTTLGDIIITPDDKFLYVTDTLPLPGLVWVIDITDPANPIVLSSNIHSQGNFPLFLTITPDQAPLADFVATQTAPLTISFDASNSVSPVGDIATYAWDFGDATTGNGVVVTHTYANPGTFSVTLTVTNTAGTSTTIIFPVGQTVLNHGGPSASSSQMITVPATCPPTPTITKISPTSGPEGTEVTITGTDLTAIQDVFFGNVSGEILSQNGTTLVVVAPTGIAAGTTVTVSVLACNGTTVNGPNFLFTSSCPPTPTITNISPTSGPAGTVVMITGTNLTDIQQVFFGAVPGLIVNQTGATLDVTAPGGIAAGTTVAVSVLACNGDNVIGPNFSFTSSCPPTPTITSLSPTSGPSCTDVTMTGTNLNDIEAVFFGGVAGTIVSQNGSSLVVISPSGIAAGTSVAVSVLACNGTTVTGPNFLFTRSCPPTPTITNISPTSGSAGTVVTITGTNLTDIQEVFFGTVPGGIVSQRGTSLVVIVPSGIAPSTSVALSVLACNGTSVTGPNFLFSSEVSNLVCPPRDVVGKQKKCHSKVVNVITWKAPERRCGSEQPVTYRIYRDAALTDLIATIPVHADQRRFRFQDRSASRGRATYFIVSVDSLGNQSPPVSVTIAPKRKHERHHSS